MTTNHIYTGEQFGHKNIIVMAGDLMPDQIQALSHLGFHPTNNAPYFLDSGTARNSGDWCKHLNYRKAMVYESAKDVEGLMEKVNEVLETKSFKIAA